MSETLQSMSLGNSTPPVATTREVMQVKVNATDYKINSKKKNSKQ